MINKAFGLVYTGDSGAALRDLTLSRSLAAMPIGGRYRAIDFPLSNLVNTGIRNVGVILQRNYHSIMDHVGSGKEWDLARKRDGLFLLPPYVTRDNAGLYKGNIEALRGVMGYIRRSTQRYCIMIGSRVIFNSAFYDMMAFHESSGADISILYNRNKPVTFQDDGQTLCMEINAGGRVVDVGFNSPDERLDCISMSTVIIEKSLLEYLIEDSISHLGVDFDRDILFRKQHELRIYGFEYKGYAANIDTVQYYYDLHMAMLDPLICQDLFFRSGSIYTKVKDEVPVYYAHGAKAENSLLADGCKIEGSLSNSVLFRGVTVGKGARLKNCIVMQGAEIQDNVELEYVILDKNVTVKQGRRLIGQKNFPIIIRKNAVI
ncbi:MAG: glucose-1-phosphate adenylyltransferase subunit GlgD [Christensenellales bacterium]